jgi:steroid delta-isomerase
MVETVKSYIGTLSSHDIAAIQEIFAADATVEDPVGSEPHVGMDAIREFYLNGFSTKLKAELTGDVRCAGNSAAFPFFVTFDAGPSRMRVEVIDVFTFDEKGKVQSMKAYWGEGNCSVV